MGEVEHQLQAYSREQVLQDELDRVNKENLRLKRRIASMTRKEKEHKRVISKQNERLQKYEDKQHYININKGPKKKRR